MILRWIEVSRIAPDVIDGRHVIDGELFVEVALDKSELSAALSADDPAEWVLARWRPPHVHGVIVGAWEVLAIRPSGQVVIQGSDFCIRDCGCSN